MARRIGLIIVVGLWFLALFCMLRISTGKNLHFIEEHKDLVQPPPLTSLDPRAVTILSLGYKSIFDDFIKLWMTQYFVQSEKMMEQPDATIAAIDATAKHSPRIEGFYMLACFSLIKELHDPKHCIPLVNQAIKMWPLSFRLPILAAYVYLFELNQPAKAAAYYAMAATRPNPPEYPEKLAKKLLKNAGDLPPEELDSILQEITAETSDENWQQILKSKYKELHEGKTP